MFLNKYKNGDIVKITDGKHEGEVGKIKISPDEENKINAYTVITKESPHGFWAFESNMEKYDAEIDDLVMESFWDDFIPVNKDPEKFFMEMTEVYPKYNKDHHIKNGFQLSVFSGDDEGPVPHVHVFYEGKSNKKKGTVAYICLGKAEYAPQHKNITKILNKDERKALQKFFETKMPRIMSNKDQTCWEYAVEYWVSAKDKSYRKDWKKYFDLDSNGNIIMPNYLELELK